MLTAIVTQSNGLVVRVRLVDSGAAQSRVASGEPARLVGAEEGASTETKSAPNPIAPESKELYWAGGSFIVLFVLMRWYLFPKLKSGMDARYAGIRGDIEGADKVKSDARSAVAEYERALEAVRAEAAQRVDKARQTVDSERQAALAEVNSRIAAKRADADAANAAARASVRGQVADAVAQVATRAAELATGRKPDAATVQQAVEAAMAHSTQGGAGSR